MKILRYFLSVFVVSRHPGAVHKLLVLLVITRTDQKDIVGIYHQAVLQTSYHQQFVLVLGEDDIPFVVLENLHLRVRDVSVLVFAPDAGIVVLPAVYV